MHRVLQHDDGNDLNRITASQFLKTGLSGIVRKSSDIFVSHDNVHNGGTVRRSADLMFHGPDAGTVHVSIVMYGNDMGNDLTFHMVAMFYAESSDATFFPTCEHVHFACD